MSTALPAQFKDFFGDFYFKMDWHAQRGYLNFFKNKAPKNNETRPHAPRQIKNSRFNESLSIRKGTSKKANPIPIITKQKPTKCLIPIWLCFEIKFKT
jgi:hypothetical protein